MKTSALKLEAKTWKAWHDRFGVPKETAYERKAKIRLSSKSKEISKLTLTREIARSRYVAFGDDARVFDDQREILSWLSGRTGFCPTCLLTDRPKEWTSRSAAFDAWLTKRRVKRMVLQGTGDFGQRDARLAAALTKLIAHGETVLVWTGALRLSPAHFPSRLKSLRPLGWSLILEAPEVRFQRGAGDKWFHVSDRVAGWTGRSPLLSLELFRASREKNARSLHPDDLLSYFYFTAFEISKRLKLTSPQRPRRIIHPYDLEGLAFLSGMRGKTGAFLRERLLRGESSVVPSEELVLLTSLDPGHVAEEAMHFVRWGTKGRMPETEAEMIVEEGYGELARRWFAPESKRELLPKGREAKGAWARVHLEGYRLGARMAKAWEKAA